MESDPTAPRVLRVTSVFRAPDATLQGRGRRFDPIGGMQNHTYEITTRLDALGVAQSVVTAHRPGAPTREAIGTASEVFRHGLPVPWLRQMYAAPAARAAMRLARTSDVVHAHLGEDVAVLPIAYVTARRFGLPWVVTVHCSVRRTLRPVDVRTAVVKALGGSVEGALLPRADAVITLTDRAAAAMRSDVGDKLHVIPPGADASRFTGTLADPFPDAGHPRVVFVGRVAAAKGVDVLIEAARRMRTSAEILVVGDGPERERLEEADRRGGSRVRFTGFVPPDVVPAVLSHADVFVLPSIYEELGSILVDALQARLPVVASATGGIPEVVVDGINGLLVEPGDPAGLAAALDRVVVDESLRARLAAGSAARATLYSWDAVAESVLRIYRSLTARGPAIVEPLRSVG